MKKLLNKFFFEVREWFADVADHLKLFVISNRIESLNEKLDWDKHFGWLANPKDLEKLDAWSKAHNIVLLRIRARDTRSQRQVVSNKLTTVKFKFEYRSGVWRQTTQNTQTK